MKVAGASAPETGKRTDRQRERQKARDGEREAGQFTGGCQVNPEGRDAEKLTDVREKALPAEAPATVIKAWNWTQFGLSRLILRS